VIPDTVLLEGTLRAFQKDVQAHLEKRVAEVSHAIAKSAGMEATVDMIRIALPTVNAEEPTILMQSVVKDHPTAVLAPPGFQTMAGEDMSFFLDRVPGVFFFLGARNEDVGACFPHHHPRFEIDEKMLPLGVELLGEFALRALEKEPTSP
jgi:amidohydrolase